MAFQENEPFHNTIWIYKEYTYIFNKLTILNFMVIICNMRMKIRDKTLLNHRGETGVQNQIFKSHFNKKTMQHSNF